MVEENINQTINFLGDLGKAGDEKSGMPFGPPHRLLLDSSNNWERSLNRMMLICAEECVSNYKVNKLTKGEEDCVYSCHSKWMRTVALGVAVVNSHLALGNQQREQASKKAVSN